MELRKQYIQMRNTGQITPEWFYRYFTEQGGKATPEKFFDNFFYIVTKVPVPGGFVENRVPRDKAPIIDHLDKKFELTLLFNKEGAFVKVVE